MAKAGGNNTALVGQLNEPQNQPNLSPEKTIAGYLKKMAPQFAQVLPKHINEDRLLRIAMTTIRTNPKLLACDISSLMAAVMQSASLGLEPGLLGHCYIIPYGTQATFIIGYKGMIDLARRSGHIQSINAHEVYENDFFELTYGLSEDLRHIPWHVRNDESFAEPGNLRGAYMVAKFKDGGHFIHYMSRHEIEQHRDRSKSKNSGPWVTDYIEMCKKTVVRAGWKWLPISIEVAEQVAQSDDTTKQDILDIPVIDIPPDAMNESTAGQAESAVTAESVKNDGQTELLVNENP